MRLYGMTNGKQFCEKTLNGMYAKQRRFVKNKIKYRKKYKIGTSPTPLGKTSIVLCPGKPSQRTTKIVPSRVSGISLSCTTPSSPPGVRFYISIDWRLISNEMCFIDTLFQPDELKSVVTQLVSLAGCGTVFTLCSY